MHVQCTCIYRGNAHGGGCMAYDCRVYSGFERHPKFIAIKEAYGAEGVLGVVILWGYAAEYRPSGVLDGMSQAGICRACQIDPKCIEYVDFLEECRILDRDRDTGTYSIHNWPERQPNCAHRDEIADAKKRAADMRWDKSRAQKAKRKARQQAKKIDDPPCNAGAMHAHMQVQCPNPTQPSKEKNSLSPLSRESSEGERVREIFSAMLEKARPGVRLKRPAVWAEQLQAAIDAGQSVEQLQAAWQFAMQDKFWPSRVLSAQAFFDNFAALSIQRQEQQQTITVVQLQNSESPLTDEEWRAMKKASVESTGEVVIKSVDSPP